MIRKSADIKNTYWAFDQYINFYAKFSKPFSYTLIADSITMDDGKRLPICKALLHFETKKDEQVLVKAGVSAVDMEGARKNVESEIPDGISKRYAKTHVGRGINICPKLTLLPPDKEDKAIFYSALYHTRESARTCSAMRTDVI